MPPRKGSKNNTTQSPAEDPPLLSVPASAGKQIFRGEPSLQEIKQLLETSIKWNEVVYDAVKKLRKHFLWMQVAGWLKVFVVVLPLVVGIFYLIPFIEPFLDIYKTLLANMGPLLHPESAGSIQDIPSIGNVSPEAVQELLRQLKNQ